MSRGGGLIMNKGKKNWVIPDGYIPAKSSGELVSHEAICVLNMNQEEAQIVITIYFENKDPMTGFVTTCCGNRANHIRLEQIRNNENKKIPVGEPYAIAIESDRDIIVQHSRLDATQSEMALMTTIAY